MKKGIAAVAVLCFTFFFSQKSQRYLEIGYTSICCGPPSEKPVISYLKEFRRKNRIKNLEILQQKGLGKEGEFALYIGTDYLSSNQRNRLVRGLMATISNQNNSRTQDSKGAVNFDSAMIVHQSDLMNAKNLTIYKK
ncbi:hypothetical protein [Chryseobacterium sp.]|uniref:hypothetical protein n=1 Tax=unclassified Chryseobacterium TaxID=2593645 RepID=UPI0028970756|nr:hypothetical protein [Chryseobacterium sp.]